MLSVYLLIVDKARFRKPVGLEDVLMNKVEKKKTLKIYGSLFADLL